MSYTNKYTYRDRTPSNQRQERRLYSPFSSFSNSNRSPGEFFPIPAWQTILQSKRGTIESAREENKPSDPSTYARRNRSRRVYLKALNRRAVARGKNVSLSSIIRSLMMPRSWMNPPACAAPRARRGCMYMCVISPLCDWLENHSAGLSICVWWKHPFFIPWMDGLADRCLI